MITATLVKGLRTFWGHSALGPRQKREDALIVKIHQARAITRELQWPYKYQKTHEYK